MRKQKGQRNRQRGLDLPWEDVLGKLIKLHQRVKNGVDEFYFAKPKN